MKGKIKYNPSNTHSSCQISIILDVCKNLQFGWEQKACITLTPVLSSAYCICTVFPKEIHHLPCWSTLLHNAEKYSQGELLRQVPRVGFFTLWKIYNLPSLSSCTRRRLLQAPLYRGVGVSARYFPWEPKPSAAITGSTGNIYNREGSAVSKHLIVLVFLDLQTTEEDRDTFFHR